MNVDGEAGEVISYDGQVVARFVLIDERRQQVMAGGRPGRIEGEVLARFETSDSTWQRALPSSLGASKARRTPVPATFVFDSDGRRLEDVSISPPWSEGSATLRSPGSARYPVDHADL